MKKSATNFFFILFVTLGLVGNTFAQAPEGIIYQAEARDENGNLIRNQTLDVLIKIIQDDASGQVVWEGLHEVTTSNFGIFVLVIGHGTNTSGTIFEDINWVNHANFLNVHVKTKKTSTWIDMGTEQLLSVPYALHSKTAAEALTADYNNLSNKPVNVSEFNNDAGYLTSEEDADPTNELQTLSVVGNDLSISDGNSVPLPKSNSLDTIGLKLSSVTIEIPGLITRTVLSVEYSLHRTVDSDGQPTSKISIDNIKVRTKALEDGNKDFFEWMCSPFEYKDGKVVYNLNGNIIKELEFRRGYIIRYQEIYDNNGLIEEFEISPQEVQIGGAIVREVWAE